MKFNININQVALAKTSLDITDGAILDYLYYLCSSLNERVQKNRKNGFTWINFRYLISEMPLLRIKSKSRISERIKKISQEGYLITRKEGNKFYVKLTPKMDELFVKSNGYEQAFDLANGTVRKNERKTPPTVRQIEHNHNTINHYIKSNEGVEKRNNRFSNSEKARLEHHLEKINDLKSLKVWLKVVSQIGFQKTIEILIDVSESTTAKNKGACAMGLAKKAGYKIF